MLLTVRRHPLQGMAPVWQQWCIASVLVAGLALPAALFAQAILVSPSTLLLTQSQRAEQITVGTGGDNFASFEVTDAFFLQKADGELSAVSPTGPVNSALPWLRVGPRRFSTEPGRGMAVRVAARPPPDLAPGEYRLHLLVTNKGSSDPLPTELSATGRDPSLVVQVPIQVSHGVRVLYRNRVQPEGGQLAALSQETEGADIHFAFDVVRLGQTSLIGAYQVFTRANGQDQDLGRPFGVSVYAELERRRFLTKVPRSDIPNGSVLCIRLTFLDASNPELKPVEACTA